MKSHRLHPVIVASLALMALMMAGVPVAIAVPPVNDYFINATPINLNALPFMGQAVMNDATVEPNEPYACAYSYQTVWYKFTPPANGIWLSVDTQGSSFSYGNVSVYRGGSLFNLNFVGCTSYNGTLTLFAGQADSIGQATYYLQGQAPCCGTLGILQVNVRQIAPPSPHADFYYYPSDPSVYDSLQFYDNSSDPGQVGVKTRLWDFGDGATLSVNDYGVRHGYAADGDYTVTLTITTFDGRSATTSRSVSVRTHDIAITRFKTPQTGGTGQTRQITVGVSNTRYPEYVHVELSKSVPSGYPYGGWQIIGTSDQSVPVRAKNRTTDFVFNYTFGPDDAAIGKVTFRAFVTISGARDALPADNEAISAPIKISKFGTFFEYSGESAVLALLGVTPNPAKMGTDLLVRFSLPAEGSAKLQLFDIAGRVAADRDLSSLGAGVHEVRIAPQGRGAPGIYWLRLSQGEESVLTKAVILQ